MENREDDLYWIFKSATFNYIAQRTRANIRVWMDKEVDSMFILIYTDIITQNERDVVREIEYKLEVRNITWLMIQAYKGPADIGEYALKGFRKKLMNYYFSK